MPRRRNPDNDTTRTLQPAKDPNRTERVKLALALRMQGAQWQDIADRCDIKGGKGAAYHLVNNLLKQQLHEATEEVRTLEILRLDKMLEIQWAKMISGDKSADWAMDRVLRIMERRAALLGLDTKPDANAMAAELIIRQYDVNVDAV